MFSGGLFWFIMGILFVLVAVGAKVWTEELGLKMTWWKWALAGLWYLLLNGTVALAFTFVGENETGAGVRSLLLFGIITVILGVGLWRLLWLGRQPKPA